MKYLEKYNDKYKDYKLIKEYSEFNQYQLGIDVVNPLGAGYGFSIDPSLSIYGTDQDSPYVDYYRRTGGAIARLSAISKNTTNSLDQVFNPSKDIFLNDIDNFTDFKILRIFRNNSLHLDVYISFMFNNEEYFGVYKNFNGITKPRLTSELFNNKNFPYMDREYYLKLSNYIYKKLENWFKPKKGLYKTLKDECELKNKMGEKISIKKDMTVNVLGSSINKDGKPYILFEINNKEYRLTDNDYFFFNYWFEPTKI